MKKRLISALLLIAMAFTLFPIGMTPAKAVETKTPTISVDSTTVKQGDTANICVRITDNPGILGAKLTFTFDEGLTLTGAKSGEAFGTLQLTKPGTFTSPCSFTWDAMEIADEDIKDGIILTLTFDVAEYETVPETPLNIAVSYETNGIRDKNLSPVSATLVNGAVTVTDFVCGDLNEDDSVDISDVILLRRYLAGGYGVTVNEKAADVYADGTVDITDVITIRRYLAGGYGIESLPVANPDAHTHSLTATAAKDATCTMDGNIAYWHCSECGKYFSDAEGKMEITADSVVIKGGHHFVDGICTDCGAQEDDWHNIYYDLANGDSYLEKQVISNTNKTSFTSSDEFTLKNVSVPGYRFLGWYDGAGSNAEQVKRITAGTAEDLELFAHWEKIEYKVQLKSDVFIDTEQLTYTVDTGVALPTPKLSNYVFTGWSDEDGHLYSSTKIPAGTTGNIYLTANWMSERNKTYTKTKLDDPIVYEDGENKIIYFAYEIGEVQNVPIYEIHNFGYISENGIAKTVTQTYRTEYSEEMMEAYASSISKATVQSSDWTLSDGWTQSTYVDQQWATENGYSEEEADTVSKSDSNEWNVSSGTYGSTESTVVDSSQNEFKSEAKIGLNTTDSSKETESTKHSEKRTASLKTTLDIGVESTKSEEHEKSVDASLSKSTSTNISGNIGYKAPSSNGGLEGGGSIGGSSGHSSSVSSGRKDTDASSTTVSADLSVEGSRTKEETDESGKSTEEGHESVIESSTTDSQGNIVIHSNSATSTTGWNTDSSYGGSSTNSQSQTATVELTKKINESMELSESLGKEVNETNHQGLSATESSANEYSSSVAYTTTKSEEITRTWTTMNTKSGYHRWVVAGTAHVFAVVTYDMKTESYSVFTYSVMDDETHEFEDYSYTTAAFNDNENGVISFSVPDYVSTYVANRCFATRGLKVDMETGVVTGYLKDNFDGTFANEAGEYSVVVIPEYYNVGDGDVVKITEISENAFKGNTNIKTVILSDYITEIPNNAFAGCTSLIGIGMDSYYDKDGNHYGSCVSKIGDNAFAGCTSFENFYVASDITSVGNNAFTGVEKLIVDAANSNIALNAAETGAKEVTVTLNYLSGTAGVLDNKALQVPSTVAKFTFNGCDGTFANFAINSYASKTIVNKTNFTGNGMIPLKIASNDVVFNQITVHSSGLALVLFGDNSTVINLGLQGTIDVSSDGTYAILAKSLSLYESNSKAVGNLSSPDNTTRICGTIENMSLFVGTVDYIDESTFDRMLNSYTLTFDANGGSCQVSTMQVDNCTAIGPLPTPIRTGYSFDGWYTDRSGGNKVTEATVYSDGADKTVFAHWNANPYTISYDVNGGTGVPSIQTKYHDTSLTLSQTVPTKTGCTFLGWVYNGITYQPGSSFEINASCTLTASWQTNSYALHFDACGGICNESFRYVIYGNSYGALPTPTRDYYTFNGWYTAADGGNLVSADTVFSTPYEISIYAHWTLNSIVGPTLESKVPLGADIQSYYYSFIRGYDYDSLEQIQLPNYTHKLDYWGAYTDWSDWSTSYVASSDSCQVETREVLTGYNKKTQYLYSRWYCYDSKAGYYLGWPVKSGDCINYEESGWLDYYLSPSGKYDGGYAEYGALSTNSKHIWWYNQQTREVDDTNSPIYQTQYRYRTRFLWHRYHVCVEETSIIYPTGDDITDIKTYVYYRAK